MKTILVIGGSSGIGASVVEKLKKVGNNVIATFLNNPIELAGVNCFKFDAVNDHLAVQNLPDSLDGVVYCPGSINLKPFHRFSAENFLEDFQLQVIGAIKVLQSSLPLLKKSATASVVLFSTVAVDQGYPFHSQVATSKGGLQALAKSLAAEWAPNIRVNVVAPSLTETPLADRLLNSEKKMEANAQRHPLKRVGKPEDIAEMVSFLLSSKSSWITGQVMHVDGGMSTLKI